MTRYGAPMTTRKTDRRPADPVTQALLSKVKDLVKAEEHTEAAARLAVAVGMREEARVMRALETIIAYDFELPKSLQRLEDRVFRAVMVRASELTSRKKFDSLVAAMQRGGRRLRSELLPDRRHAAARRGGAPAGRFA